MQMFIKTSYSFGDVMPIATPALSLTAGVVCLGITSLVCLFCGYMVWASVIITRP